MKYKLALFILFIGSCLAAQNPNDCDFSLVVCGTTSFGLDPNDVGEYEFDLPGNNAPPCFNFNTDTIWMEFNIETDGTLAFDLVPDNDQADYDFAIFGPNVTCTSLGDAIRCSSTNPQAAGVPAITGLNNQESDFFEGPGADGNGFLRSINAFAGERYIMVIGRPIGIDGFSIVTTGSAGLPEQPIANPVPNLSSCDMEGDVDNVSSFNFDALIPDIVQGQNDVSVSFHSSLNDSNLGTNPLSSPYFNVSNPQTIYYRIEKNTSGCFDGGEFTINVESPFEVSLPQGLRICDGQNNVITLITEAGFSYYQWSNGQEGPNLNEITVTTSGEYSVIVTDVNNCNAQAFTTIVGSEIATIISVEVEDFAFMNNTATVIVQGSGDYEYAIDSESNYQDENVFSGLANGYYTIYVRDKNGCGVVTTEILILDYPRIMTPNNDGIQDRWSIIGLEDFPDATLYIFDRFGKLMKQVVPASNGWDGNYNGRPLYSNDYWFKLIFNEGRTITGHFTLKR